MNETGKIKAFEEAREEYRVASKWVDLRAATDSQSGTRFIVSSMHSSIKLTICGQKYAGAQNYHESPKAFDKAILKVIASRFDELSEQALKLLHDKQEEKRESAKEELEAALGDVAEQAN